MVDAGASGEAVGLRELKRRATENAIEAAAVRIALEEGVDAVTVDRICAEAFISRSTFFNYFPSRDAAIFGKPIEFEPNDRIDEILATWSEQLPIGFAVVVFESIGSHRMNREVARQRIALVTSSAEIAERVNAEIFALRRRLERLAEDWFERHPEHGRLGDARRDAQMSVAVAVTLAETLYDEVIAMSREGDLEVTIEHLIRSYERVSEGMLAYSRVRSIDRA